MMKNNDEILKKIKKCLALSKSANEHEAATALRQAQKLMQKYGIDDEAVAFSDVAEERASAKTNHNPPRWSSMLAGICADAFGCEWFISKRLFEKTACVFVGISHNAYLASYAYEVLLRQLTRARKDYYTRNNKRCKQSTRVYRADQFALGYALRLDDKVKAFAGPVPAVVSEYMDKTHSDLSEIKRRKNTAANDKRAQAGNEAALAAGWRAGKDSNLHHPVGGDKQRRLS